DVVALPAGTVHAIGKGLVVAEVQQNSDLTLRIYDYGRMGLDGKPRKLHVKEAYAAIRFNGAGKEFDGDMSRDVVAPAALVEDENGVRYEAILSGKYFDLHRVTFPANSQRTFPMRVGVPSVAMVLAGEGSLNTRPVCAGRTALLPAALKKLELAATT